MSYINTIIRNLRVAEAELLSISHQQTVLLPLMFLRLCRTIWWDHKEPLYLELGLTVSILTNNRLNNSCFCLER